MSNHELMNHDPKCHAYGYGRGQRMDICICTGIRIGRAEERENTEVASREVHRLNAELDAARERTVAWMDRYNAQVEAERQAWIDLRAKVEGLPMHEFEQVSAYYGDRTLVVRKGLCRADVLALLDEVTK